MAQAFYRKWRPQTWDDVVGQAHVVLPLRNAVASGRIAHAYLFSGPRGTGKTTTARLLAKAANCTHENAAEKPCNQCEPCIAVNEGRFWDMIEIDAASNTSVDDVRALRDKINFSPNQGRYKVYIIDEVHMLSTAAFNALLKTLEEPPEHAMFILATTDAHKIPATVLSRCQRHEFRLIPVQEMMIYLTQKVKDESLPITDDALRVIVRQSTGCLRDAISLLDQISSGGETITVEFVQSILGTATGSNIIDLIDALQEKNIAGGLSLIHATLDRGVNPRHYARQIVDYLRDLLLIRLGDAAQIDATKEVKAVMERHAQAFNNALLLAMIRLFNRAATESRDLWQPALPIEMALIESALPRAETAVEVKPAVSVETPTTAAQPAPRATPKSAATKPHPETSPPAGGDAPSEETMEPEDAEVFNLLAKNWRQVAATAHQRSPHSQGLLNSCKPVALRDGCLELRCNNEYVKGQLEKAENLDIARWAIAQVINKDVVIKCVFNTSERGKLPPGADSDGIVAAALDVGGVYVKQSPTDPIENR